ncbi:MAG: DUF3859 domain-containing protein [Burkholderiales bacterium]|nr:DUF3859 domain-containing protein [Burkholderiales bacterium]
MACAPKCDIVASGQYVGLAEPKKWSAPESTTGERQSLPLKLVRETQEIEAKLGQGFGFEYALSGVRPNAKLQAVVVHPPIPNTKGELVTGFTSEWSSRETTIAYWFGETRLLVPGQWSLRILHEGKPLCERSFTVRISDA